MTFIHFILPRPNYILTRVCYLPCKKKSSWNNIVNELLDTVATVLNYTYPRVCKMSRFNMFCKSKTTLSEEILDAVFRNTSRWKTFKIKRDKTELGLLIFQKAFIRVWKVVDGRQSINM